MPLVKRIRPRLGDVIEIATPKGLAYAHYTHKHAMYGALMRVLPNLFTDRPISFSELVQQPARFLLFFPLGAACNRGIVSVVAEENIPSSAQVFPTFRAGFADDRGQVKIWWLWDGQREWRVDQLSPEQALLPIRTGVWNDTLLVERIVNNWQPSEADLIVRR